MRKVFFIHPRWQLGGVELTNEKWAEILSAQGGEPITLTYGAATDNADGMPKHNFSNLTGLCLHVMRHAGRHDTVLVCQSYFIVKILLPLLILKLKGCHLVLTERNSFDQYMDFPIKRRLYAAIFPIIFILFDRIIVNASEMKTEPVYRYSTGRTVVFKNPRFDAEELARLRAHSPRICNDGIYGFCRWSSQKDPEFMRKAAAFFNQKDIAFHIFCGRDDYDFQRPFVPSALTAMMDDPRVLFFCSKFEGYPNLLLEARVVGLPIIYATCQTGVGEILDGYELAFEFSKDDMQSLHAAYLKAKEAAIGKKTGIDLDFAQRHGVGLVDTQEFVQAVLRH